MNTTMARPKINSPAPFTLGVLLTGEEVAFPTPSGSPGSGLSRATVKSMVKKAAPSAGLVRSIYPAYDVGTDADPPDITYKILAAVSQSITILGNNLTGIVSVIVSRDVNDSGNAGSAPVIGTVLFSPTSILVPLDGSSSTAGDFWGVTLVDSDGNEFAAPSPIQIVDGV